MPKYPRSIFLNLRRVTSVFSSLGTSATCQFSSCCFQRQEERNSTCSEENPMRDACCMQLPPLPIPAPTLPYKLLLIAMGCAGSRSAPALGAPCLVQPCAPGWWLRAEELLLVYILYFSSIWRKELPGGQGTFSSPSTLSSPHQTLLPFNMEGTRRVCSKK